MVDRRSAPRSKRRLVCDLLDAAGRAPGIVLDLSAKGLFVQTSAAMAPGARVQIELELPGSPEPVCLQGRVARRRAVPARLRSVVTGGLGIELTGAPEAFYAFVAQLQGGEAAAGPAPAQQEEKPQSSLARKALMKRMKRLHQD